MSRFAHDPFVRRHALIALCLTAVFTGCAEQPTAPLQLDNVRTQVVSSTSDATWSHKISGETGPGALYSIHVPHDWNGGVVYYAHGFVDAALPIALPGGTYVESLRSNLGARGFAFAASSYSENGFAVKDGMQRTHQLRGLFTGTTQLQPTRSYLIGQSLGGAVALALAEDKSSQYDGVMPVCGLVGGSMLQTQYLGNVRTLYDALFPGTLPGSTLSMPANINVNSQIVGPAQAAVLTPAGVPKLVAMAMSPQTPLPTNNPQNIPLTFQSLATALSFHARGINDILDRTNGKTPFDNEITVYSSPLWTAPVQTAINAAVARFAIAPSARNYLTKNWAPSGNLAIPTLTLHNRFDPVVPMFHEDALASLAASTGTSNMLVRRIANAPYGHCAFDANEVAANFDLLVTWVESGVRPQ